MEIATTPDSSKLRVNTHDVTDRKPNQEEAGCWWKGPGLFNFLLMFHTLLILVAKMRGWETNQVQYIRVGNVEGDPRIYFWPTDENDPDRIELRRNRSSLSANLSTTMIKWKMALASGQRNRYDVLIASAEESPVGPALYINKDKVLETKWSKKSTGKKNESTQATKGKQETQGTQGAQGNQETPGTQAAPGAEPKPLVPPAAPNEEKPE